MNTDPGKWRVAVCGFSLVAAAVAGAVDIAPPKLFLEQQNDGSVRASVELKLPESLSDAKRVTLTEIPFAAAEVGGDLWTGPGWAKLGGEASGSHRAQVNRGFVTAKFARKGYAGEIYRALLQAEVEARDGKLFYSEPAQFSCVQVLPGNDGPPERLPLPAGSAQNEPDDSDESFVRHEILRRGTRMVELKAVDCLGAVWSDDGKYAYFLERPNILRKIESPSMVQKRIVKLPEGAGGIGRCAQGLVIWTTDGAEVKILIYDPATLELRRELPEFESKGRAYTSPGSNTLIWVGDTHLGLVDLAGRQANKGYTWAQMWAIFNNGVVDEEETHRAPQFAVMSPDGKSFFAFHETGAVVKFSLSSSMDLRALGASAPRFGDSLTVTPNNRFITVNGWRTRDESRPARVYSADEIKTPRTEFTGAVGAPHIFMPQRCYYSIIGRSSKIGIFDGSGEMVGEYGLEYFTSRPNLSELVCPRAGAGFLATSGATWYFIEPRDSEVPDLPVFSVNRPVGMEGEVVDGWKVTGTSRVSGVAAWSLDGKSIYCVDGRMLQRISYPELIEQRRLYLDQEMTTKLSRYRMRGRTLPAGFIGATKAGLAVSRSYPAEIWILDPESFDVIRKIAIPAGANPNSFAAAPGGEFVFVPVTDRVIGINVETGAVESALPLTDLPRPENRPPLDYREIELIACRDPDSLLAKTPKHLVRLVNNRPKLSAVEETNLDFLAREREWAKVLDVFPFPSNWTNKPLKDEVTKAANPRFDPSIPGIYLLNPSKLSAVTGIYQGSGKVAGDPSHKVNYAVHREFRILSARGDIVQSIPIERLDRKKYPVVHPKGWIVAVEADSGFHIVERVE